MRFLASVVAALVVLGFATAQTPPVEPPVEPDFVAGSVRVGERTYPYRLLEPPVLVRHLPQPLVVFLHGAGERGSDNEAQLKWLPEVLARPGQRQRYPCYLLAVQCPQNERWVDVPWESVNAEPFPSTMTPALSAVLEAMDRLLARSRVDRARVYLTGLSMGGYGAWDLAARFPDRFAAVMPVCGGGDERVGGRFVGLPTMVFHGAADPVVTVQWSRQMVAAIRARGGHVDYRELPGVGHDSWRQAYGDDGGLPWLFAQDQRQQMRGEFATYALVPRPDLAEVTAGTFKLRPAARVVTTAATSQTAALFATAMTVDGGLTVPLTMAKAVPGDMEFRLDPTLAVAVSAVIADTFTITARDEASLRLAAAMAFQALHTWPDLCCPTGNFTVTRRPAGGRIIIPAADGEMWSGSQLIRLVRLAWLYSATELLGPGFADLSWLDEESRTLVRQDATRGGIALLPLAAPAAPGALVFAPGSVLDVAGLLSQSCSEVGPFSLAASPASPNASLTWLQTVLPAVAERAARAQQRIHVGGFCSRLGALLRR